MFKKGSTSVISGAEQRLELYQVPVPKPTNTYCPVSHQDIIEAVLEQVDKSNLIVKDEIYNINAGGDKVMGRMLIQSQDEELGMMLAFKNSYNKSMSLGFAAGGNVFICSNGMVVGDVRVIHKHTWGVKREIERAISETKDYMHYKFNDLLEAKNWMKDMERPSLKRTAELMGKMYFEDNIITANQLGVVKRELEEVYNPEKSAQIVTDGKESGHFYGDSMWDFYNNITESLKGSSSDKYIENHINIHKFFEKNLV